MLGQGQIQNEPGAFCRIRKRGSAQKKKKKQKQKQNMSAWQMDRGVNVKELPKLEQSEQHKQTLLYWIITQSIK